MKYRTLLRKLIYRPRASILRVKQLEEPKLEKELRVVIKFAE